MTATLTTRTAPPAVLHGTPLDMVKGFHAMYDVPISTTPNLGISDIGMRIGLLHEEFVTELIPKGLEKRDAFETADALADFIWVVYSLSLATGVQAKEIELPRIVALPVVTTETIAEAQPIIDRVLQVIEALDKLATEHPELTDYFKRSLDVLLDDSVQLAVIFQVDLKYVLEEVALSNASKLLRDGSVLRNPAGKVLKGPDFFPPKLARAFSNAVNPEMP